jgi:GNAT superfamily N-acetyltransferase
MLSDCAAHVEVASDDGKRVGFFVLRFERLPRTYMGLVRPLVARVDALAVIRSSRGRGIGRALVERAEYVARREGAVVLTLMTAQSNRRGRRLFASSGFLPLLTWEQGYENGDSGLELWKPLLTGGHSAKR